MAMLSKTPFCCLIALALGLTASAAGAQQTSDANNPSQAPSGTPSNDPARAARSARLLAEFRAILDASVAEQTADAAAAAGTATTAAAASSGASGSPPASGPAQSASAASAGAGNNAPSVRWPKDPKLDYTGFSCEFFTRPAQAGSGSGSHADGVWIAYGERMYQCVNRRWRLEGPVAAYADGWQRQADLVER